MPRRGKLNRKTPKNVVKPTERLPDIVKTVAKNADQPQHVVKDVLNCYYDHIFDCLVDNKEVFIPGIGRLWFDDPKPHRYWDEKAGKIQHTLTYPVLRFRPVEKMKDSLHGEVFRQMKLDYKARIEAMEAAQVDKEFDKQFNTKKP